MALIKRFGPLHLPGAWADVAADRLFLAKVLLYTLGIVHVVLAIVWSYTNTELYAAYTTEDGYVEHSTAFVLLMTSFLCLYKAISAKYRLRMVFFSVAAMVFFFGFGEEISWGQRILGFGTPEGLQRLNQQEEFTLHNLQVRGISLNKLIFSTGLYTCVFVYFLVFPVLYRSKSWFKCLVDRVGLPIPSLAQSFLYLAAFFGLLFIQEDRKWEVQEFALACFIFFAFLLPANKNRHQGQP